jgi:stage II sporulation protein R
MNRVIWLLTTCAVISAILIVLPTEREGEIYRDTIRLHILANSDEDGDQRTKISVRDFILENSLLYTEGAENKADAERALRKRIPEAERRINEFLSERGIRYGAKITLTEEWYDTRDYEGFSLPSGIYTSYRVILGKGGGQNWWCVMYPPICKGLATDNSADDAVIDYTSDEMKLISSKKYRIKFKILESLSQRFKK